MDDVIDDQYVSRGVSSENLLVCQVSVHGATVYIARGVLVHIKMLVHAF